MEDDQLAEIYYERENEYTLAGSVYKGRVTRVLPGMQSAFVDIGLERDAFLYVTDFLEMEDQEDTDEVERAASQGDTNRPKQAAPVAQQAAPKVAGVSIPMVWDFVIENPALIPREYCDVSETRIRRVVTAMQGNTRIPGVRVFQRKRIAAGRTP